MEGVVRAIIQRHAQATLGLPASPVDPNALVPARPVASEIAALPLAEQRRLGQEYVRLWSRTFQTLVAHLRGRPERALALFVEEVYPFLLGRRDAAVIEEVGRRSAVLRLGMDLPHPYLAGLLEGFVGMTEARVEVTSPAEGRFHVRYNVGPTAALARLSDRLATQRVGLVVAAVMAALTGIAVASRETPVEAARVLVVVGAAALAQAGGNAIHDLLDSHPAGPLAPFVVRRSLLWTQAGGCMGAAALLALWLATTGSPVVLAFAGLGLVVALLYGKLRDRGWGPAVALVLYGPLIAAGAWTAFVPVGQPPLALAAFVTLVPGALAAAVLYVDDLADLPLDEAGGKRTLAVRLPRRRQASVFAALLFVGLVPVAVLDAFEPTFWPALLAMPLLVAALLLARRTARGLDEPQRLAPARIGAQLLHVAATALAIVLVRVCPDGLP
jgi:1,4-dihydroxy-2-naphthoate octaprenyltransferase